ncbi:hypothetical protein DFH11DRAFT_1689564 [Phellopilus nigrolimitatus]|nr:hypothetical protein DFH11DRAFT_1689564 [Phellopilus nigrolimitatus]
MSPSSSSSSSSPTAPVLLSPFIICQLFIQNSALRRADLALFLIMYRPCLYPPRTHDCGALRASDADRSVVLAGWILPQRKISNSLSFFSLKDSNGATQLVFNSHSPASSGVLDALAAVPVESVVLVQGSVRLRPQNAQRQNDPTGEVEVVIEDFMLLNPADHTSMPFLPSDAQNIANEELRARFRHLDLRRQPLTENLRKRSRVAHAMRDFLHGEGFVEVETPMLLRSSPEGAREFLVPTRVARQSGSDGNGNGNGRREPQFYALAQSPQQPKQLLICSGAIARCFRDEDGRRDRQPEFTQLDLEMAFVSWGAGPGEPDGAGDSGAGWRIGGQEVRRVVEALVRRVWTVAGSEHGAALPAQFPVMTYADAMARFGSDKPDTRFGLEEALRAGEGEGEWEGTGSLSEWLRKSAMAARATPAGAADADAALLHAKLRLKPGDAVWLARRKAAAEGGSTALGRVRLRIAQRAEELGTYTLPRAPHILWVTEFPLFTRADGDKDERARGRWSSSHHPFTAPVREDVGRLFGGERELASIRGQHYDLVLNGVEIGGGSVRVHDPAMQEHIFTNVLQLTDAETATFGHLLHALRCGAPPHGGFALGLDRLMAMLCGAQTIRDVIAFPKAGTGADLLFKSPSGVADAVLAQYGLKAT